MRKLTEALFLGVLLALGISGCSIVDSLPMMQDEASSSVERTATETMVVDTTAPSFEITEGTLLSDEDIDRLCNAIALYGAGSTNKYAQLRGSGELNLSVAGPLPVYWFDKAGSFDYRGTKYLIFDDDEPILLVYESLNNEANNAVENVDIRDVFDGIKYATFSEIVAQSTTRRFAIIKAAGGTYLYDGVDAIAYQHNYPSEMCSELASVPSETPGIDAVELAGIDVRQHFDF